MTIMSRLKTETRELHTYAETRPLQKALIQGTLARETYVAYLGQMLLIHATLEAHLRSHTASHPAFTGVFKPHQQREANLQADLEFHGSDPMTVEPLPTTTAAMAEIDRAAAESPIELLGMLYVLEGSTNGSKFIARSLTRAYNLEPGPGLSYLDPYADRQQELWGEFKSDMERIDFTFAEMDNLVEAAKRMFQMIACISDELYDAVPA